MGVSYRRQLLLKGQAIGKSVNWMNFYIFTRLPVMLITGIIGLIANFSAIRQQGNLSARGQTFVAIMLAAELVYYGLSFITYLNMKKTKPLGFYLNFLVLLLDCVALGFTYGLQGGMQMGITSALAAGAIWLVPNAIYFIKRKEMFYLPEQRDVFQEAIHQMMMGAMPKTKEGDFFQTDGVVNPFEPASAQVLETQQAEEKTEAKTQEKAEEIRSDLYTYCPYCGKVVEKEAKVCGHCHRAFDSEAQ